MNERVAEDVASDPHEFIANSTTKIDDRSDNLLYAHKKRNRIRLFTIFFSKETKTFLFDPEKHLTTCQWCAIKRENLLRWTDT